MRIQSAEAGSLPVSTQATVQTRPEALRTDSREPASPPVADALSPQATQDLVKEMNQALQSINTGLEFSLQDETGRMVIKVIDLETKETLRQFPSEEAIAIANALEKLKGVLIRQSA